MEEDIEILEEFVKYFEAEAISTKYRRNISITVGEDDIQAIENLIKGYRELEVITNGIKVLETNGVNDETFFVIAKTDFLRGSYKHLLDDYIPKSKIKEKIKKYKKKIEEEPYDKPFFEIYINTLNKLLEDKQYEKIQL